MTRAKNWIGFLAAAGFCAGPVAALAQSPLSPQRIESQPLLPPPTAAPAPAAPAAATPAPAATPAAQAPAAPAVPEPVAPTGDAPSTAGAAPSTADGAPALQPKPKPKPKPKPAPPPREMALSDDPTPVLQPETFFATAKASERYANIVDAGGWPVVPGALSPGAKGPGVVALRRRLAVEGDLTGAEGAGAAWSPALTTAVKRFQFRNGLKQTGVVAGATLRAINISANVRFKQLASSAQRLAGMNFTFADKYVAVNLPSTAVDAIENGVVARRYAAIVGGPEHQSPQISAKIVAVNLNPTWTVPESIIKNEIIPKMRKQPNYLSRARIKILDSHGAEINPHAIDWNSAKAGNFTLRQDSGAGNSLGLIRIAMPNPDAVYMHDTPSRNLFANDYRFLSHGCVRVEGVYDLAAWLLRGAPGAPSGEWTRDAIQSRIAAGAREDVKLPKVVPVIWVYMTGWASADGTVHFRDDVYNVDTVGG
ncbi:L,D-transpeptidase family protein [uncultured Rhodoblastus sp.]|uniref:L,D-transpeptidase family protein n=1 Tax=uncultured Rhodoblastus sp. TaxID=543037 RepID=UPI0025EE638A|nr:L,D-transpeptidase family protein [uncultured Rhodoblastus sp.]